MDRIYFFENQGIDDKRDNSPLFKLRLKLNISIDEVYSDIEFDRKELHFLLDIIQGKDRLFIRSILDLAESEKDLLSVLQVLDGEGVELVSIQEPYLNGFDYLTIWQGVVSLYQTYKERARATAYQRARETGTVGRPIKEKQIEKAMKMLNSGCFTMVEIEKETGVSRSTLYRHKGK